MGMREQETYLLFVTFTFTCSGLLFSMSMKARHFHDLISDLSTSSSIALHLRTVENGLEDMDENCSVTRSSNLAVKVKRNT